ncbi:unnamed protein product [Colias eurytheme]|nr:unnamed protein product [Colias eurytheme]
MRVKTATQLFSHSVTVATEHLSARGDLPESCKQLIDITLLFDKLFDSLNEEEEDSNKCLQTLEFFLTEKSTPHAFDAPKENEAIEYNENVLNVSRESDAGQRNYRLLRRIRQNDALGADKKPVIYLDETWIHSHYTVAKCWQSSETPGVLKNTSAGSRWIIAHAGGETGFVDGAFLMFKAKTKTGDYHDQMNGDNFMKWLTQQLLPNMPKNCLVVIDNAPYHSFEENKPPTMNARKLASEIEALTREAVASITVDDWRREVNHVKRLEANYAEIERLEDDDFSFIINTGGDSSDSDSNEDSVYDDDDAVLSGVEEILSD